MFDAFCFQNSLKQDALSSLL